MTQHHIVELLGDGISPELSRAVHQVAEVVPGEIDFQQVDMSLAARTERGEAVYDEAVAKLQSSSVGLKYPTATVDESPNKVLRDRLGFAVIHRPVATIPGIENNFKRTIDVDIVRIGLGGTYEDAGQRLRADIAVSLRVIQRQPSLHAARFAFKLAMLRNGGAGVVSTSKYTIQKAADGLFEEAVADVAQDYPSIPYRKELFDALLAGIIMNPDRYQVIVCPNEYGDFLSDTACGLIGSIGLGDSASYAFRDDGSISCAMFDPAGGTAPDIAGQNICNPTAALLAFGSLLRHTGHVSAGKALRSAIKDAIAAGEKTTDIGGTLKTDEFTAVIANRLQAKLAE